MPHDAGNLPSANENTVTLVCSQHEMGTQQSGAWAHSQCMLPFWRGLLTKCIEAEGQALEGFPLGHACWQGACKFRGGCSTRMAGGTVMGVMDWCQLQDCKAASSCRCPGRHALPECAPSK